MKLAERIKEAAATGYILLWLLGIPIPISYDLFTARLHLETHVLEMAVSCLQSVKW
jgi:hypothetical protein